MQSVLVRLLAASTTPTTNSTNLDLQPGQAGNLPGDKTLVALASGVGHWALLASMVGVIVGGVMWPSRPGTRTSGLPKDHGWSTA